MFRGVGNRGGVRGGKDQFNWDEVRGDKYKEFYLGQATRISGDNWWNRGQSLQHAVKGLEQTKQNLKTKTTDLELAAIKQQEQQLMLEALGLKPKTRRDPTRSLDKHEFRDLIKKGSLASERDETDVNRVGGLGYEPAPHVTSEGIEMASSVFLPKYSENPDDDEGQVTKLEAGEGGTPMQPRRVVGPVIPRSEDIGKKEKKEKKHKKEKKSKKEKKEKRKDREEDSRQSPKRVKSDSKEDRSRDDRRDRDTRDERSREDHREDRREERRDRDTRDDRSRDDRRDTRDDRSRDDRRDDRSSRRDRRDY